VEAKFTKSPGIGLIAGGLQHLTPKYYFSARKKFWPALIAGLVFCSCTGVLADGIQSGHSVSGETVPYLSEDASLYRLVDARVLPAFNVTLDWNSLKRFYASRAYTPVWHDDHRVSHDFYHVLHLFEQSRHEGLFPNEYHLQLLAAGLQDESVTLDELELLLTDALLKYLRHSHAGRFSPETVDPAWHIQVEKIDFVSLLQAAISSDQPLRALVAGHSRPAGYHRLKQLLLSYRSLATSGGWTVHWLHRVAGPYYLRGRAWKRGCESRMFACSDTG